MPDIEAAERQNYDGRKIRDLILRPARNPSEIRPAAPPLQNTLERIGRHVGRSLWPTWAGAASLFFYQSGQQRYRPFRTFPGPSPARINTIPGYAAFDTSGLTGCTIASRA